MPKTLITYDQFNKKKYSSKETDVLFVSECFYDTIQGENFTGTPSVFIRLQYCTLKCTWCDTLDVWSKGNGYKNEELLRMFEIKGIVKRLQDGHHLILTGGSPLKQQDSLFNFLETFEKTFGFHPFVEIENECVLQPSMNLIGKVDLWNNSPKLDNCGMKKQIRYKPDIIRFTSILQNSWFKFVITRKEDWDEIEKDFLQLNLIRKNQIVLMPEGQDRQQLQKNYDMVVDLCCEKGVRFTDRQHVTIWNRKTGV